MKKIFYLASIAALAFSSCAKDDTTQAELGTVTGGSKITAAMGTDTRTYLDENKEFRWEGTDAIAVYNDNAAARMNGTQFKMTEGDKSTVAVFNGPALNTKYNHLAVYPWTQQKAFTDVVWAKDVQIPGKADGTKGNLLSYNATTGVVEVIKVNIPATQEYYPGTFGNGVVPAISTRFDIAADGSADVSMQPVADYLFVDIMSVEPIKELKLQLREGTSGRFYTIAGEQALTSYLLADGSIRYYMGEPESTNGSDNIKLVTNERAPEVSCHEANTYVFVVPAGILGMGNDVTARLYVNGESNTTFAATSTTDETTDTRAHNWQLNWKKKDESKAYSATNRVSREDVTGTDAVSSIKNQLVKVYNKPLENTYFYMNDKDADGNVIPFVYNPNNEYIIEHEGQLLKYLTEYDAANGKNAFICSEHEFDFSLQNMRNLTTELKANGSYNDYQVYISNYLADNGTFPCVEEYAHEFKGNGAVITDIERPLASMDGIFGEITGTINDVTFDGIVAASTKIDNVISAAYGKVIVPGIILGSIDDGELIDVTVDNAQGNAILGTANVAAYNELTVSGVSNLNYIIGDMDVESDIEIKNWNVVKGVKSTVFSTIDATDGESDSHHVVKLPAGADYAKLAQYVSTSTVDWANYFEYEISGYESLGGSLVTEANQNDNYVLSVLIGDESYWTGDKTNWTMDLPKKVGGTGADKNYYKLEYAEQLAMGADANNSARVMRNMHLESAVNPWEMVTVNTLDGNNKTISGVYMNGLGLDVVAPVDAEVVTNLVVDGVTLDLVTAIDGATTYVVPSTIAGLAVDAKTVTNVTVKNLVIDAYAYDGTNNTEAYYGDKISYIGWLVAEGTDIYVTNSKVEGVDSNVRGIAGLVGHITLKNAAQIDNSSATVKTMAQTALTAFAEKKASHKNVAGTAVGLVTTNATSPKDIKFKGIGKPVFLYDTTTGITVVYDNVESKTYKNWGY